MAWAKTSEADVEKKEWGSSLSLGKKEMDVNQAVADQKLWFDTDHFEKTKQIVHLAMSPAENFANYTEPDKRKAWGTSLSLGGADTEKMKGDLNEDVAQMALGFDTNHFEKEIIAPTYNAEGVYWCEDCMLLTKSTQWRLGRKRKRDLCNAHGLKWLKEGKQKKAPIG